MLVNINLTQYINLFTLYTLFLNTLQYIKIENQIKMNTDNINKEIVKTGTV